MVTRRRLANRLAHFLNKSLGGEAGGGVILIVAAVAAMIAANSPLHASYEALLHASLPWTPVAKLANLHQWINDGLMAVFFFVVGLEIKREVLVGELSEPSQRRLPVLAASAGMIAPALCFLAIAGTDLPLGRGWAIPAATDIAFALGVVGLLGKRVPPALRLFLLTVAIVDDVGAVAIIALFYTASISLAWLAAAALCLLALAALSRAGVSRSWPYLVVAVILWYCVLHSGVHATVAGVVAALAIPLRIEGRSTSPLLRFEHALAPWNAYLIVPLFGLANAGVALGGARLGDPLPLAVAGGLLIGKQAGIFSAIVLGDRLGIAPRPQGASWMQLWGISILCGIGFTMSLFIGGLAFADNPMLFDEAKLGILIGSLLSALLGFGVLRLSSRNPVPTGG